MIPKRVPGQLANHAMVLVEVMTEMCKDQVRHEFLFQRFECVFDWSTDVGKKAIAERFYHDCFLAGTAKKSVRTDFGFASALRIGTKDQPVKFEFVRFLKQLEDGSTAADLDVVTVRSQAENAAHPV